ncbi:MAG: tetratricopeptide repeat protein [Lentisphaeria bacterium]|nr:tetratricopeptide repeat protein [Lentisphaeria bacterium]
MFKARQLSFFMMVLAVGVTSAAIRVSVQPEEVFVGETAWYSLVSDLEVPKQVTLPDVAGLTWLPGGGRTGERSFNANGKTSFQGSVSYAFRYDKEGTVVIPGAEVTENGKRVTAPAVNVVVKKRRFTASGGKTLTLDDLISLRVAFPGLTEKTVFLGQEVPLQIQFSVAEQLDPKFSYPVLDADTAVIKDFSRVNADSAQFAAGVVRSRIKEGIRFREVTFDSALTPLATGKLAVKGAIPVTIYPDGRQRGFMDDFFGARRGGQQRTVTIRFPDIEVAPPPALPADAGQYLGLVGEWSLDFALSAAETKVGEPVTATLTARGTGGTSGFTAPAFTLPNYRIYEPEITKDPVTGGITVAWALIPLSRQAGDIVLSVCTLNPANGGHYVTRSFAEKLAVSAGDPAVGTGSVFIPDNDPVKNGANTRRPSSLLYIKNQPGKAVALPLTRNHAMGRIVWAGLAVIFFAACEAFRRVRPGMADQTLARRREALKRRSAVIRRLETAGDDSARAAAREDVVGWLVDMWGCPPGTSVSELADIAEQRAPDIAADLRALDHGEFAPEAALAKVNVSRLAAGLRLVKSLLIILASGVVLETAAGAERATFADGVAAYDAENYAQAEAVFSRLGRVDAEDPVLMYNRANCLFETGQPALALALYSRALKLSPRDSDIRENLNYVRSELGLPVRGAARDPGELLRNLRDSLRPDEWLLAASVVISLGGVAGGVMVLKGRGGRRLFLSCAVVAAALYGIARQQLSTSYREDSQAVVVSRQAVAWRHPSTSAEKAEFVPAYGENVRVMARRTGWALVKTDGAESWMRDEHLHPVW